MIPFNLEEAKKEVIFTDDYLKTISFTL